MNHYHGIWAICSHTLAPLTRIIYSKVKIEWTKSERYAFGANQWIVACYTLLAYPDFYGEFKIHTNATKLQLGAVISQKAKPIALYSIKLTVDQKRYRVT